MFNNIKTILLYSGTTKTNTFFYFLKNLPIFKHIVSNEIYSFLDIKKFISVIMFIGTTLFNILLKFLYVLIISFGVNNLFADIFIGDNISLFLFALSLLSIFGGIFRSSTICDPDSEKYNCIKLLRMPAKDYCVSNFIINCFYNVISFTPAILILGAIIKVPFIQSLFLTINIICAHIIAEIVHMTLNKKFNTVLGSNIPYSFGYIIFFPALYCCFIFLDIKNNSSSLITTFGNIMTSLPVTILLIAISIFTIYYILKYDDYNNLISKSLTDDELEKVSIKKNMSGEKTFKDVKLKDNKDLVIHNKKIDNYTGYKYLNELFFERHKRMLIKPVYKAIGVILGLAFITLISYFVIPSTTLLIKQSLNSFSQFLPIFPFMIYFLTLFSSERACRAMFFNCDISLLHYPYYRKPKVVLETFRIRLKKILKINLLLCGSICLSYIILIIATNANINVYDTVLIFISIISIGAFFSIYHLFAYYIFQPFSTDLKVKNPFYNILNVIVYLVCFYSMKLNVAIISFAICVTLISIIFCIIALILVYKLAPKTFKIK